MPDLPPLGPARPSLPPAGQCHLWLLGTHDLDWHRYDVLDEDERDRVASFIKPADRLRYLAAHAGTRIVLGRYLRCHPADLRFDRSCDRCEGQHGKPRVTVPVGPAHFSLSHSGRFVLLAVATCPVGADVQIIDSRVDVDGLADGVLAVPELSAFDALPPAARRHAFFVHWARKEALLKTTGEGLRVSMKDLVLSRVDQRAALLEWRNRAEPPRVQIEDAWVGDGYTAAVAAMTGHPLTVCHFYLYV